MTTPEHDFFYNVKRTKMPFADVIMWAKAILGRPNEEVVSQFYDEWHWHDYSIGYEFGMAIWHDTGTVNVWFRQDNYHKLCNFSRLF